ncbi:MAG: U32 family peptidase [Bacteroidales bacterium]|nr:U32 family peptidase [Bacteroidales bacterium]
MRQLELLAPAKDAQIGIAAIDCGADAVYIAGPQFGARQAAGNDIEQIRTLCAYAHRYGARIFVTLNTILFDNELEDAYHLMLDVQEAGADAIIVQDLALLEMARSGIGNIREEFRIPLHASTQCAIRTPEHARFLESLGFSRLILERELSLEQIKEIREAVSCELEFFVHGALCVCYSGQCYLSEHIAGRSANRGACIQACRSRYDLTDSSAKVLVKDKALLSLKDFNLHDRLEELAEAGITSFKIEGRLKNVSYVRNVVRYHSIELDRIVGKSPEKYERGAYGRVRSSFVPDPDKTFNRGYTELYIDGRRGRWAAMDAAKSMGEEIGVVAELNRDKSQIIIKPSKKDLILNNGDGFSFVDKNSNVSGFRGDVCSGRTIRCKATPSLFIGARIFRNMNAAYEKELEKHAFIREIRVDTTVSIAGKENDWLLKATATSEDGRTVMEAVELVAETAQNQERMRSLIEGQIGKASGIYLFRLSRLEAEEGLPIMSASFLNSIRRNLAERLEALPCIKKDILRRELKESTGSLLLQKDVTYKANLSNNISLKLYKEAGARSIGKAYELSHEESAELMRSRYCIRYELGICPVHHNIKDSGPLYLTNNGRRLALHFDCRNCEMIVRQIL